MTEMIINTEHHLAPGDLHLGWINDATGNNRSAIRVIRTATEQEYLNFVEEQGLSHKVIPSRLNKMKFYVIEILD